MADPVFDNISPETPAETAATRTEIELRRARELVTALEAKLEIEQTIRSVVSIAVRNLAVALHGALCPSDHPSLVCTWFAETASADNSELADWTKEAHMRWLGIAQMGVALQQQQGWTIAEPAPPAPEEPPPEEPPAEPPPEEPPANP